MVFSFSIFIYIGGLSLGVIIIKMYLKIFISYAHCPIFSIGNQWVHTRFEKKKKPRVLFFFLSLHYFFPTNPKNK